MDRTEATQDRAPQPLPLLREGAAALGLRLSRSQLARFGALRDALLDWNSRHNLTSITDPAEVERLHFLDSLSVLLALPRAADGSPCPEPLELIDVGSGGGLPGLPLRIACPELSVTFVESVGKKAAFIDHAAEALRLSRVRVIVARAEEVGADRRTREWFDIAVARAVAALPVLAEFLLPLVRPGGLMVALKKGDIAAELAAATAAIRTLGGAPAEVLPVEIPGLAGEGRCLVVVRKRRPTPTGYPRRVGLPAKRPIGSDSEGD